MPFAWSPLYTWREHVHLLVCPTEPEYHVDQLLRAIKRPYSFRIKPLLEKLTASRVYAVHHVRSHHHQVSVLITGSANLQGHLVRARGNGCGVLRTPYSGLQCGNALE